MTTLTTSVTLRWASAVRAGRVNLTVLLWALGVPLPLVLIIGLLRGCS
jgi:hypothetical protein